MDELGAGGIVLVRNMRYAIPPSRSTGRRRKRKGPALQGLSFNNWGNEPIGLIS